jgi:hypothetical protein
MGFVKLLLAIPLAFGLGACGSSKSDRADMEWTQRGVSAVAPMTLGVNAYLWQAALETFSFLPVANADPFGGVILFDWYSPPSNTNERMKATVYIMDRALRTEGLKVKVFRQVRSGDGWQYVQTHPELEHRLEDAILTRARQLRFGASNRPAD